MTEQERNALLPAGLRDVLPGDAAFEAEIVEQLIAHFATRGYDRVKPPLIEFEDGLLSGAGVAVAPQTFRLMDPVSQRMMGLRADITPQIARIARSRLANSPRPLRLSYAGDVLRVRGTQLRPERQIVQVGAELIGSPASTADAEIITMAIDAIANLGITGLSVDLTVPQLVPKVFAQFAIHQEEAVVVRQALDRKDVRGVASEAGLAAEVLCALLSATGPVDEALPDLAKIDLPHVAAVERSRLFDVIDLLRRKSPKLDITLDPVEHRGFEYHTGIGFTIFSDNASGELAAGGRYRARHVDKDDPEGERATGVTLYVDTIMSLLSPAPNCRRIFAPHDSENATLQKLHADGWVTITALETVGNLAGEAIRMGCSHILTADGPKVIDVEQER